MAALLVGILFCAVTYGLAQFDRVPPSSILGGFEFSSGNIYHVSLNHKGVHKCSAALLVTPYDRLFAVTAASCLPSLKASEYTITYGKGKAGDDGDEYCILSKIKVYEDFDKLTLDNDLALLLSDDNTNTGSCNYFINSTLGVVLGNNTLLSLHVRVSGWDEKNESLRIIEDEVIWKSDVCNDQLLAEKNLTIGSTMLCHGVPNDYSDPGKCRAEKGSPVVAVVPQSPPLLVGITSWTLTEVTEEELTYPCVGTGVIDDTVKKWIQNEIEDYASR